MRQNFRAQGRLYVRNDWLLVSMCQLMLLRCDICNLMLPTKLCNRGPSTSEVKIRNPNTEIMSYI